MGTLKTLKDLRSSQQSPPRWPHCTVWKCCVQVLIDSRNAPTIRPHELNCLYVSMGGPHIESGPGGQSGQGSIGGHDHRNDATWCCWQCETTRVVSEKNSWGYGLWTTENHAQFNINKFEINFKKLHPGQLKMKKKWRNLRKCQIHCVRRDSNLHKFRGPPVRNPSPTIRVPPVRKAYPTFHCILSAPSKSSTKRCRKEDATSPFWKDFGSLCCTRCWWWCAAPTTTVKLLQ